MTLVMQAPGSRVGATVAQDAGAEENPGFGDVMLEAGRHEAVTGEMVERFLYVPDKR